MSEIVFDDPRLKMTFVGRALVRVAGYIGSLVLIAAIPALLLSDVAWVWAIGALLALFAGDRLLHRGESDRLISEIARGRAVNAARAFSPHAFGAMERAFDESGGAGERFALSVALRLTAFADVEEALERLEAPPREFRKQGELLLAEEAAASQSEASLAQDNLEREEDGEGRSVKAARLGEEAFRVARGRGGESVLPTDLFAALPVLRDAQVARLFNLFSIEPNDLVRAALFGALKSEMQRGGFLRKAGEFLFGRRRRLRHRVMNRAWTARPTPTLDAVSNDLTDLGREGVGALLVGHEKEYARLTETLVRGANPNALLVGDEGVGKETLVAHLGYQMAHDEVPPELFDKRLISLKLSSLVAGAPPEELQARLQRIVREIVAAGNVILYIPEIHNLVRTSGTAYLSAADALLPIVMGSAFPTIGATYPREFAQFIESRSDFAGTFEVIRVDELDEEEAERLLVYQALGLETDSGVRITFGAVKAAVRLAKKYFHLKPLPGSAEGLLESAVALAKQKRDRLVGRESVVRAAEAKTNVPIHEATTEEAATLLNLEALIHERLVDQNEAVAAVARAIREYRSGLTRRGGPIASFLFVGPTGVGKTELAKILARIQFGSESAMIRFDMTEYQDKASYLRLIGSPEGTVRGALTDAVLEKPFSLVLLDEFEKAFPDTLNLFLQVLDDGRLTDNLGRTIDFQNTIFIATSNAHSDLIVEALRKGENMKDLGGYVKERLVDVFRPELLNRFSEIVVFKNLEMEDVERIAAMNLGDLGAMLESQGIAFAFDEAAVREVARFGYDPAFGARPLRRAIEERVRAPLAEMILKKEVARGGTITLAMRGGTLQFVAS